MRRFLPVLIVGALAAGALVFAATRDREPPEKKDPAPAVQKPPVKPPKIDIAIALDTSSSMTGLLQAARQKLWEIVNEVAQANPTPDLRVALLSYGKRGSAEDGYVEIQSDLTTDLDAIYAKLMALDAVGGCGQEYVARAVSRAVKELSWRKEDQTLRQIYVAGNESTEQDPTVNTASAVKQARSGDIFVNTIFCAGGQIQDHTQDDKRDVTGWRQLAEKGQGLFASINHTREAVAVASPYDDQINALGAQLNNTYVGYGKRGTAGAANQRAQDDNARRIHPTVAAARAQAKASGVYRNDSWDLVDARKAGKLTAIKDKDLPQALRGRSKAEVDTYLDGMERKRRKIQKKIKSLSKKRRAYVAKRPKKKAAPSFGTAVKRAIRKQAAKKKIRFKSAE